MVFIQIPSQLTEEELLLQRKYQKLKRKKKALQAMRAPKPEPQPIQQKIKRTSESGTDAKEVAKKLLKSGKIHAIKGPDSKDRQHSGFKRSKALERKRCVGADKPGGYQPFHMAQHPLDDEQQEDMPSPRIKPIYESFVPSRDPESIAREETFREKRKDGKANYVNRDTPQTGNTIYIHGFGINESLLKTGFSMFGNILDIKSETDKNCSFITFDSIDSANKAIDEMHLKFLSGVQLKVSLARRQPAVVDKSKIEISEPVNNANAPDAWSSIAANYSSKSALKDKRSLLSYEESDLF